MKRIGVVATSLSGERPTGLGVYTREVVRHTPWPEGTAFIGSASAREHEWPNAPHFDAPVLPGLAHRLLWQAVRLDAAARRQGCALLYAPTHELVPTVGLPYVMVVHDLIPLLFPHLCSRKLAAFFRYALPRACRRAAQVIAISEHTKADLVRHYGLEPARITVIPNGYDRAVFRLMDEARVRSWASSHGLKDYVLYVGRLSEPKNVGRLIEAFAKASPHLRHDLVIAGPDEKGLRSALMRRASELGVGQRVRWLDYLRRDELPLAYGAASLFVTASLYEGFGLPPLEAMACGTPVLVSGVSSLPEVVGDAGVLFDPNDPGELAERMVALLNDPQLRQSLSVKGLTRAEGYSWERTGAMTRACLDEVVERLG